MTARRHQQGKMGALFDLLMKLREGFPDEPSLFLLRSFTSSLLFTYNEHVQALLFLL